MNESLKSQEQEFKAHCKAEMQRLKDGIDKLQIGETGGEVGSEEEERERMINEQYEADREKMQKIRLSLVSSYH